MENKLLYEGAQDLCLIRDPPRYNDLGKRCTRLPCIMENELLLEGAYEHRPARDSSAYKGRGTGRTKLRTKTTKLKSSKLDGRSGGNLEDAPLVGHHSATDALDENSFLSEACASQQHIYSPVDGLAYSTDASSYHMVHCCISMLIEGFSTPSFQQDLQKRLMKARLSSMREQQISRGCITVGIPGRWSPRDEIERVAFSASGLGNSSAAGAWEIIARFVHEEAVVQQLSIVDELLALPRNSYFQAIMDLAQKKQLP